MSGITDTGPVTAEHLSVPLEDVRTVEGCAARAWPPTSITSLSGWQLRYSPGVTNRRANSVLPIYGETAGDVSGRINEVERFYLSKDLPSRFMISPAAQPLDLDAQLEGAGYYIDAPTSVQWASMDDILKSCGASSETELITVPSDAWMAVYMEGVENIREVALKKELIGRIEADHVLAQISGQDGPVAVGLGVCEREWVGVFCMHTLKTCRGQGLARRLLGGLAHWARQKQVANMYLQVEQDNPVARRFYESAGFVTQYGYHYRTKESGRVR